MVFRTPSLEAPLAGRLGELDELRSRLGGESARPRPWLGALRRQAQAESVASSTSIEGFEVGEEQALAIVGGGAPAAADDEDQLAVEGYAHAMEHVTAMATDPHFQWLDRVILDLHFDACRFQRDKSPGRWRDGPIAVTAEGGGLAFRGPDAADVPGLMAEVTEWLRAGDLGAHPVVRAAMAHLHLVSVHPFADGNGRVARIVQSLVLARDGVVLPELGSIEPYLAENTAAYYSVLQEVQGGSYQPDRDASPWIAFCVDAHRDQAQRRLDQVARAAARWAALERLAEARGWPDRLVIALEQSLIGGTDRGAYAREAGVSTATASNDLRRLLDSGLIDQEGRGRAVRYRAGPTLRDEVGDAR